MPPDTKPEHAQKKAAKKPGSRSIMDDAPLFAGLDDFVLNHAVRKEVQSDEVVQQKEKQKSVARKAKKETVADAPPRPVAKLHRAASAETGSVLLSVTEICALLKISRATLIRMDKSGKLPGRIKLGGSVRFHRETIETWLLSLIATHPAP